MMDTSNIEPLDVTKFEEDLGRRLKPGGIVYTRKDGASDARPTDLLSTREATHGDFRQNARVSQSIKTIFRACEGWDRLDDVEREAMDMIALKFSRILAGKSLERQHWEDVIGYARLVEREYK